MCHPVPRAHGYCPDRTDTRGAFTLILVNMGGVGRVVTQAFVRLLRLVKCRVVVSGEVLAGTKVPGGAGRGTIYLTLTLTLTLVLTPSPLE